MITGSISGSTYQQHSNRDILILFNFWRTTGVNMSKSKKHIIQNQSPIQYETENWLVIDAFDILSIYFVVSVNT